MTIPTPASREFRGTVVVLVLLLSVLALGTQAATPPSSSSAIVLPGTIAAVEQLRADVDRINSRLTDPRKHRLTDISKLIEKYIPIGSTVDEAEALMQAMGCRPPLRLSVGQSASRGYRRPSCTWAGIIVNSDKSESLGALVALPGRFLEGHWLTIDAKTSAASQRISSVEATIDIRTVGDL